MKNIVHTCRKLSWTSLAMSLFIVLTGCSSDLSEVEVREKNLSTSSEEIVIGVAWPFAEGNDQFNEGLQLALEQVNQAGVLEGKTIRLIERDDEGSVTKGMAIAQEFAENTSITAVIGHRNSSVTIPAAHIYNDAGILLLAPASSSLELTTTGSTLLFRNVPSDDQLGQAIAKYVANSEYRNIAIYYTDDEYNKELANSFENQAYESGLRIVDRLSGYKDAADVERLADKWKVLDVELVLVATGVADGKVFIRELRDAGSEFPIIGGSILDSPDFAEAGEFVEGTIVASVYNPLSSSQKNEQFRQQFMDRYGVEPGKWAAQAYDSLQLLVHAIELADSRSSREIAEQLANLKQWEGVAGSRSFTSTGDVLEMDIVMKKIRNGAFDYSNN